MTMLSFNALTARNNAILFASDAAGVRAVSYWTSGKSTSADADATVNARVQHTGIPRNASDTGRKEQAVIECQINKSDDDGGLDSVDPRGYLGFGGKVYQIVAVENGDSVWRVIARLSRPVDVSAGRGDYLEEF